MSFPPTCLRIRDIVIDPCTILAPMEGVTDAGFRSLIRAMGGCGLVVTEFINSRELSRHTVRAMTRAQIAQDQKPVSIQIYGRDAKELAESAKLCEELGADLIDINMGCPSKAVTKHCSGVALMREPSLARAIVRAVRAATRVPLTVKMRLGWDHGSRNATEIARMCQEEGVEAVTVHGRTKADAFSGRADWAAIGEVKRAVRIPVIGNGDILTVADALEVFRVAGVDGVMVGRGTLRNPWLLRQIGQALRGESIYEPTLAERRRQLLDYYALIVGQFDKPLPALGKMKKVTGYFTHGLAHAADLRQGVFHSHSVEEAVDAVHRFFDRMEQLAELEGIDIFRLAPAPAGVAMSA